MSSNKPCIDVGAIATWRPIGPAPENSSAQPVEGTFLCADPRNFNFPRLFPPALVVFMIVITSLFIIIPLSRRVFPYNKRTVMSAAQQDEKTVSYSDFHAPGLIRVLLQPAKSPVANTELSLNLNLRLWLSAASSHSSRALFSGAAPWPSERQETFFSLEALVTAVTA